MPKRKEEVERLSEKKKKLLSHVEEQLVLHLKELGSLPATSLKTSDPLFKKLQSYALKWRDET
ncbi:MAG: hypothetical protein ACFFE8_09290 [Candidatus Heimdallarchaeota archaeon]